MSFNVFTIESIESDTKGDVVLSFHSYLNAKIDFKCDEHGNNLAILKLKSESRSMDQMESIRAAIENMLNHQCYPDLRLCIPKCSCRITYDKIHHYDFSAYDDFYREFFESILQTANWSIVKLIPERLKQLEK
jgi:hypothetical protein